MQKVQKTREEIFAESYFEWVKTERQGDVCRFQTMLFENDVEYVLFTDGTRVRADLVGDIVLAHAYQEEILGREPEVLDAPYTDPILSQQPQISQHATRVITSDIDPVVAILEKTKKKTEKITLTLNLKIPAPDLYNVIKENFDNTDEILLNSVMDQIHDNLLRDALKKELQTIYQKRKRVS